MKVLFVCGSYPPDTCTMSDVAEIMTNILRSKNVDVEILANIDWSIRNWPNIRKIINTSNADVIHVQYPTSAFKYSVTPQMISFFNRKKVIVTIHEVSQAVVLRKISLFPFSFCKKIVFTNRFEKEYFRKIYPFTNKKNIEVIPIGSNIHSIINLNFSSRQTNIVHFGQMRPKKGIEQVIELAGIIKRDNLPFRVIIMGRTYDKFKKFYEDCRKQAAELPIDWFLNVSEEEVSKILGANMISYLPFPDGVSERRGSLFASLLHNMIVFTTKGSQTLPEFDKIVVYKESPQQVADVLRSVTLKQDLSDVNDKLIDDIKSFLKKYDWDSIMNEYIKLYQQVTSDPYC